MADPLAQLTREWLTKAAHDLQTARIVSASPDGPLDTAIYHCQQAAEKALKGWLTWRSSAVAKTHDLVRLVDDAVVGEPDFERLRQAAETLTPYASAFRYPGVAGEPMPTREEFNGALGHAEEVFNFVVERLPAEAKPLLAGESE